MIPSALASQLQTGLRDFLRLSFSSSTPGMDHVIDDLLDEPNALFQGPFVSVKLPFRSGTSGEFFPELPLGFDAHEHQVQAFERLSGPEPQSTLIATGTGSGKTESFLWPILDHCRRHVGTPGIKAILIYPMNALATDQAGRIAKAIHANPSLAGAVRAGLFIGADYEERKNAHKTMGPDHIITDRTAMQLNPPDILLTNYKMLDYLLIRPGDQELWAQNGAGTLRYLVVDELHTFDGAQGTDLACLLRRLKARLRADDDSVACVGTSATLGGEDGGDSLRRYACDIFGADFDPNSVVRESRLTAEEFFDGKTEGDQSEPDLSNPELLDPTTFDRPEDYVLAQCHEWFESQLTTEPWTDAWRLELGDRLHTHTKLRTLVGQLAGGPVAISDLVGTLALASADLRSNAELGARVVNSFLALVSEARTPVKERSEARKRREATGEPPPTKPFLEVRLQLWQRELARMVASVSARPRLRFSDDLSADENEQHLPLVHCRDCGAMGWATMQSRAQPNVYRCGAQRFYGGYFGRDPQVRFLWPADATPTHGEWAKATRFKLDAETLVRVYEEPEDEDPEEFDFDGPRTLVDVVASHSIVTENGKPRLTKDCPFCAARASLTLLGFRAATLTSLYIDQLFASTYNDDKKLLTFSDSVQDAAHRAGFVGARTWRTNLRVALQQVVKDNDGALLSELPGLFASRWLRSEGQSSGLEPEAYVATFLAPNMDWLDEYEALKANGELPTGHRLFTLIEKRVAFEIFTEFGHQARIGRSLNRTGCATATIDAQRLGPAVDILLEVMRAELGGFSTLDRATLTRFIVGGLRHLAERGGLAHSELPTDFVESGGRETHGFNRAQHLPSFGPTSRMPALLTNDPRSPRFDAYAAKTVRTWYQRWADLVFDSVSIVRAEARDVWSTALRVLSEHGVLTATEGKHGSVWGVAPDAMRVSTKTSRMTCDRCGHWQTVAADERDTWCGMPCLSANCTGRFSQTEVASHYFPRLYERGDVCRVFPEEHTGLLKRTEREAVEEAFKAQHDRQPWSPNLLSCTPTLEMGIDIGALSSAILCSVPPTQSNYLQRIGRAGRRDGNSLLITIAQARPHDNHFFKRPLRMIAGEVDPPGIFLDASAVLERQLAAFCLDQWNAAGAAAQSMPRRMSRVFEGLAEASSERFPYNWIEFVQTRDVVILGGFFELFGERINNESKKYLEGFLRGEATDDGSLAWKVLDAFHSEKQQRDSLKSQAAKVKRARDELSKSEAKAKDHEKAVDERDREYRALLHLVKDIEKKSVLEFLTDQGLLPNYAFPESPIRLRSVIWRPKRTRSAPTATKDAKNGGKFETTRYEYARPAMAGLTELAPANRFFAGGRQVVVDQIDVATSTIERWRFCDQCSYSQCVDGEKEHKSCPNCTSATWGEASQKAQLLKLQQVFANTADNRSRIRDDKENRDPRHYNRRMLMSFDESHSEAAWTIDDPSNPFGFEYIRRASFREFNFGEFSELGDKFSIAGREGVRQGFVICKECGKVQQKPSRKPGAAPPTPEHSLWCPARKHSPNAEDYCAAVYLYREFNSEAIRLLLPLSDYGDDKQLNSFVAGFQLGLREKYGGSVDHLHTMVYSEPDGEGYLRRQYLVLYDTVPGGTGYLKDFAIATDGEEHPLLEILDGAWQRIATCTHDGEPEADGCYGCLYRYRSSRDMKNTSANAAKELFSRILRDADKLVPVKSLSSVKVSGLMDSVLEARFVEALKRLSTDDVPIHVTKALINHKPGFQVRVGSQTWRMEQQLTLDAGDGIVPTVSIDFVLHPPPSLRRRPLAVFLDGLQHHRNRVGKDMLQRMTLQTSGRYDVWSLSWYDVDEVFHSDVGPPVSVVADDLDSVKSWFSHFNHSAHANVLTQPMMHTLRDELANAPRPWAALGADTMFAQLDVDNASKRSKWNAEIDKFAPVEAVGMLDSLGDDALLVYRPPTPTQRFGVWAAADPSGLGDPLDPSAFRVLVWLDDSEAGQAASGFRDAWRGFFRAYQLLRDLPHVWFVSTANRDSLDYSRLGNERARLLGPAAMTTGTGWAALDVEDEFIAIRDALSEHGLALPTAGKDLPDAAGHTSGLEAEFCWDAERVAIVEDSTEAERPVAPEWVVYDRVQLETDGVLAVVQTVRERGEA